MNRVELIWMRKKKDLSSSDFIAVPAYGRSSAAACLYNPDRISIKRCRHPFTKWWNTRCGKGAIAEVLLGILSKTGLPREILSDNGSQFTSHMMKELQRLLSIKPVTVSLYRAQCNSVVEKYNGVLKSWLKKIAAESRSDCDHYIEPLLFA